MSKEMAAPPALNFLMSSMATARVLALSASEMPLVWKMRASV